MPPENFFSVYYSTVFVFLLLSPALASESDHKYQVGEQVTLWTRTVGPYNNPKETYNYYSLPFCNRAENYIETNAIGEVLGGVEIMHSLIGIAFLKNVDKSLICQLKLDEDKVKQFKDAIENRYWFELYIDDLPMWGFIVSMIIVKTLRNDNRKYAHQEEDGVMERLVVMSPHQPHGPPRVLVLISAAVGTGAQLVFLLLLVMLVTIVGTLYLGYVLHFSYDELLME
ncbi:unnamed protein product [Thlaspi arvense]|uniref:Transmembrane 9 superfamily member n=1 Tax=Thlaspi arvense TaxID=13288 RepID=A0AAU9RVE1_THLAR|nr:unnamed protein product [Thlaspi arvense]